ncbi:hypothetical protein AB4K05_19505 [Kluyvera sp. STS39-E]
MPRSLLTTGVSTMTSVTKVNSNIAESHLWLLMLFNIVGNVK